MENFSNTCTWNLFIFKSTVGFLYLLIYRENLTPLLISPGRRWPQVLSLLRNPCGGRPSLDQPFSMLGTQLGYALGGVSCLVWLNDSGPKLIRES